MASEQDKDYRPSAQDVRAEGAIESLRWKWERLTFASPEEFKQRRGEDWFSKGRNHRTWADPSSRQFPGGIERQVRDEGDSLSIGDDDLEALSALCVGRTITAIERERTEGGWTCGENSVTITLDDGAKLDFYGWGHDASGVDTSYTPATTQHANASRPEGAPIPTPTPAQSRGTE